MNSEFKIWKKAKKILGDNQQLRELILKVEEKTQTPKIKSELTGIWKDFKTMFSMVKDWVKRDYKEVSYATISLCVFALLYLVTPLDAYFDFLPGGFVDDITVITLVLKKVKAELEKYKGSFNQD